MNDRVPKSLSEALRVYGFDRQELRMVVSEELCGSLSRPAGRSSDAIGSGDEATKPKFRKNMIDMTGQKHGRWTVIKFDSYSHKKEPMWSVQCECGNVRVVRSGSLQSGNSKSCGCLSQELKSERFTTHGQSGSPEYIAWRSMRQRCYDKNHSAYPAYGGRGITVCKSWESFDNFLKDMGFRPSGTSIDRIDNSGNYEPTNCRWATQKTQARNTRRNHYLTFNGETYCISEWAEITGIGKKTIEHRVKAGWSVERTLTEPVGGNSDEGVARLKRLRDYYRKTDQPREVKAIERAITVLREAA